MRGNLTSPNGFTVTELLVVIAIIVILAALLLPVLGSAKTRAQRTMCVNNLHQINLGVRIYSDDANDSAPSLGKGKPVLFRYRQLLQSYFGLNGPPSPNDKVFACPSDTFYYNFSPSKGVQLVPQGHYAQSNYVYSSYEFNGANQVTNAAMKYWGLNALPGISGYKLSSIRHPAATILVAEASAYWPYSWHQPKPARVDLNGLLIPMFNNSDDVVSFVDGHVGYLKMYWNSSTNANGLYTMAYLYNPPPEYAYQWSPD